jgi:hypothetical protein
LDLDFGELPSGLSGSTELAEVLRVEDSRAVADLRGLLARDVPLAFGFGMRSVIIRSYCQMFLTSLQVFISEPLIIRHPVSS